MPISQTWTLLLERHPLKIAFAFSPSNSSVILSLSVGFFQNFKIKKISGTQSVKRFNYLQSLQTTKVAASKERVRVYGKAVMFADIADMEIAIKEASSSD